MDQSDLAGTRVAQSSATREDDDEAELLTGTRWPLIKIRPASIASKQVTDTRGRHSRVTSKDLEPIDEYAASCGYSGPEQAGASTTRQRSPHPTSASSLFRRFSTLKSPISPIFRSRSTRKALGKYNEIGDDYTVDDVPVDLSSLTGMGFEMMETPRSNTDTFADQETAYVSPSGPSSKPGFANFVKRAPRLGDFVVGAEFEFDPSKATPDRAKSSSRRPEDADLVKRSKTVRMVGHNLAQERQTIVAVTEKVEEGEEGEGIDISSFEGSRLSHRVSSQTLGSLSGIPQSQPQTSYFFPEDQDIPNWRPFSMSTWYISLLIGISVGLASFQEWLCQHSISLQHQDPPRGILEFNQVAQVPLWDFFAWKCKLRKECVTRNANEKQIYLL